MCIWVGDCFCVVGWCVYVVVVKLCLCVELGCDEVWVVVLRFIGELVELV